MDINKDSQYNISSSKFKMLSSTSGVGSVITTKWGGFIMPLSIDEWAFIRALSNSINDPKHSNYTTKQHQEETGVEVVDDDRFVKFLQYKKGFANLRCFAAIPHVNLSVTNYMDYKEHPLFREYKQRNAADLQADRFYIPAVDFPKWFISSKSELKRIDEWYNLWLNEEVTINGRKCKHNDGKGMYFAPPRDPHGPTYRKMKDQLNDPTIYKLLSPVSLVLICENGHISDIDWYKYFCAMIDGHKADLDKGFDLFDYPCDDHCEGKRRHSLKWIQNRNQSESWGTLKCEHCQKTVSLAGIMNIKVFCRGEKPWEPDSNQKWVPSHEYCRRGYERSLMQVAMVTSNSIYYAFTQNSLYVPLSWTSQGGTVVLQGDALDLLEEIRNIYGRKLKNKPDLTKEEFIEGLGYLVAYADGQGYEIDDSEATGIKNEFLGITNEIDVVNTYRLEEFKIFVSNDTTPEVDPKFEFNDIKLDEIRTLLLRDKFLKIKQVPMLAITSTQLGFGRVNMPTPRLVNGKVVYSNDQIRPIYSGNINDVKVLPANQIYGEGLFFAFDSEKIKEWSEKFKLEEYYNIKLEEGSIGTFLADEMKMYGRAKFYLLHTFSHLLMKELEFSCGYPTASLSERLYYSDEMCGVLIYTADGSEGSMGGLVWQGQPELIEKIILSALQRATDCSADPLCWENSDGLNKAACFSCAMVSETSCEQQNLGLDRRALVDPEFGFFRDLI